jgi:hypothetical protein
VHDDSVKPIDAAAKSGLYYQLESGILQDLTRLGIIKSTERNSRFVADSLCVSVEAAFDQASIYAASLKPRSADSTLEFVNVLRFTKQAGTPIAFFGNINVL